MTYVFTDDDEFSVIALKSIGTYYLLFNSLIPLPLIIVLELMKII